jgi:hypothetical protein
MAVYNKGKQNTPHLYIKKCHYCGEAFDGRNQSVRELAQIIFEVETDFDNAAFL